MKYEKDGCAMPSRPSSLAPRTPEVGKRRSLSVLVRGAGSRLTLRPKRDALTRVRHDLRSLVHSVVGYSELLAEPRYGALSPEQARFVTHVRSAAEHMQELVDACIELSRPAHGPHEARTHEQPSVSLVQLLRRIRGALSDRRMSCDVTLPLELEAKVLTLDLGAMERALVGLSLVVTRDGAVGGNLHASRRASRLVLSLRAADAGEADAALTSLDLLEDKIGNRDFVRLKLSEVLLSRQAASLRISSALDAAEIELVG
jgi:hypothetical protein